MLTGAAGVVRGLLCGWAFLMPDSRFLVVITDCDFEMPPVIEQAELDSIGARLVVEQCKTEDDVIEKACDADGLLEQYVPITARVVDALSSCKVIVRYGTGMDPIDVAAATDRGMVVSNVRGYQITSSSVLEGMERIEGQTLGLVGFGATAQAVAIRSRAFGLRVIAHSPRVPDSIFLAADVERVPFDDLLRQSDFVSVHTPLRQQTFHLIGAEEFEVMKPTAYLINTARGAIVDNDALARVLASGHIAGAGLDVTEEEPLPADSPLRDAPNLIVTPHGGFYSRTSLKTLRREAAAEVARVLRGDPPNSAVGSE